ncbi:unnamed protein product [Dovyalis caffra]|uniref:NB-ARC domain-containing protein n=1 Tax=Dovyalis caffra TaxID=77055 RepID=A0AAV1S4A9_9ROSI|nr:unnamed protein product [Dovyalis caffra]
MKKETLKTSLIKLRDLVYEADDVLTDCILRSEYQKDVSCTKYSPAEFFFRYQMGKQLKEINSRMNKMESNLSTYLTPQNLLSLGDNTYRARVFTSQDFDPSEIIGIEEDIDKLQRWASSTSGILNRIGIVGMGGLGKTTIAQKFFDDKVVSGCFEKRIWASVSQDFSEERLIRSILEQLGQNPLSGSDLGQMLRSIAQSLQGQSCLIVMDDVWSFNQDWWSKLCSALQKTGKRSCVLITTRNEDVATRMGVESSRIHHPKVLDENDSWSLFCNFAFSQTKGTCPNLRFEKVGKEIVGKCGGLPLAIKTIAALLAPKAHNLGEWKDILDHFHELTTREQNSSVKASLQLSYDALPTHLKQFLLCISIYPEDFVIQAEQLVHWWVGEGFIQGDHSKTAEDLGYEYLTELVRRCLVEVVERRGYDGRVYSCKMHDLVRDLTTLIAEDEMFCSFEAGKQKLSPDSRWLGFTSEMSTKPLKRCSKLRALLLMATGQGQVSFNKIHMESFDSLRVLDLSHIRLNSTSMEKLLTWIFSLKRLAYLNLSGAVGLKEVPSSIRKLRNLQLLILAGCSYLTKLHPSISYLKNLIVLDCGSCGLQYLPHGIGKLSQLQELSGFRVVRQSTTQSCHLLQLEQLVQLRVLRMNLIGESEITESECDVLSKLVKLRVLAINTEDCKDKSILEMLDKLQPPPSLQELYLRRYRHDILPKWVNPTKLSVLRYLCIENGDLNYISPSTHTKEESASSWNYLEGLCLKFLPNLEDDCSDLQKTMQSIRYVEVSNCFNLKNFPCSVHKHRIWRKVED